MPDAPLSDDDITRLARDYVAHRRGQPHPPDLEGRAMAFAFGPHGRVAAARLVTGALMVAAVAIVVVVGLAVHVAGLGSSPRGGAPSAAVSTPSITPTGAGTPAINPWAVVSSYEQLFQSATGARLNSVTCVSADDCWALSGGVIEHYAGGTWSAAGSPQLAYNAILYGISCPTASECWAVGATPITLQGTTTPLIEHYSGGTWTAAASPDLGSSGGFLNGVACVSSTDCWAVGGTYVLVGRGSTLGPPLIEHYAGSTWGVAATPGVASGTLLAITCPGATDCWAVGSSLAGGDGNQIEHYSAGGWRTVVSPDLGGSGGPLNGVACVTDSDCWAVGGFFLGTGEIEHFDGARWSVTHVSDILSSVACVGSGQCWAVGSTTGGEYANGAPGYTVPTPTPTTLPAYQPVIEYYSAAEWSVMAGPPGLLGAGLSSVACVTREDCWAVGGSGTSVLLESNASAGSRG